MSRTVTIGDLPAAVRRLEKVELPVVDDLLIVDMMHDAFAHAATQRRAVAVLAGKGNGKSMALRKARTAFEEAERAKQERAHEYRPEVAVIVPSPRTDDKLEVLDVIWKAVLGIQMQMYVRNRKRGYDDLKAELAMHLLNQNVAVLAFDEAEKLSRTALDVIRDLMSETENTSQERLTDDERAFTSAGVGVVLSGTIRLKPRLEKWGEAGQRVLRVEVLGGLPPVEASDVYRQYLPAFEERAQEDEESWLELVRVHVCNGRKVSLREIENHTRSYIVRLFMDDPELESTDEIPWDEDLFIDTLNELDIRSTPRADAS